MRGCLQVVCVALGVMATSCYRSGPTGVGGEPVEVTVMSFNILHDGAVSYRNIPAWPDRRASVLAAIQSGEPDVVGLQEAYLWQVSRDLLPGLSGYRSVGAGSYAGNEGVSVSILFRQDRFDLVSSGHFWLSDAPDTPGSIGGEGWGSVDAPRMVTWVELRVREAARNLYVYNTHLAHGTSGAEARRMSALLIARRIADRARPEAPFFLTGDFNANEDDFPVQYLLNAVPACGEVSCSAPAVAPVKVIDAWRALHAGHQGTRCRNDESGRRMDAWEPRVDYVFLQDASASGAGRESLSLLSSEVMLEGTSCPSDHLPVVATVELRPVG